MVQLVKNLLHKHKTWVWISIPMLKIIKAGCGKVRLQARQWEETKKSWFLLTSQSGQSGELHDHWGTLSQKTRWRATEGDTQHWSLTSTCMSTHNSLRRQAGWHSSTFSAFRGLKQPKLPSKALSRREGNHWDGSVSKGAHHQICDLNLILRTPVVERENYPLQVVLWSSCMHSPTTTQRQWINVKTKNKNRGLERWFSS